MRVGYFMPLMAESEQHATEKNQIGRERKQQNHKGKMAAVFSFFKFLFFPHEHLQASERYAIIEQYENRMIRQKLCVGKIAERSRISKGKFTRKQ